MKQILIVEDDKSLNQGLCRALRSADTQLISCTTLKDARDQLLCGEPALVLLDINLPDGNGLSLLKEIKTDNPSLPVILLTANDMESDIVAGLEQGADDYITKPFSLAILRARVNTQLRKTALPESTGAEKSTEFFQIEEYSFDFQTMRFFKGEQLIELSKTEQKLLRLLVENPGIALSRSRLVDRIWTDGAEYVDENALSVTVKRLRDKLQAGNRIKTVYGIGYMWVNDYE
ncbi:MAG: response regulator transcription factor [Clostridiales bacterium]|nr:response regulator transcription factor [Clostridiales bacterium]